MTTSKHSAKRYLTAKEALRRIVFAHGAWCKGRPENVSRRVANFVARVNAACNEQALLQFMGRIVFHGPEYDHRKMPIRHKNV